jgi:hypothetical protein
MESPDSSPPLAQELVALLARELPAVPLAAEPQALPDAPLVAAG